MKHTNTEKHFVADDSKSNLTGGQIQTVMDTLLYDSLRELVLRTSVFDTQLAYLLSLATSNKKRRIFSGATRERALTLLVLALSSEDKEEKMALISSLQMERHFIYVFLKNFLTQYYDQYMELYRKFLICRDQTKHKALGRRLDAICSSVGAASKSDMFHALNGLNTLLAMFFEYYSDVIQDFVQLCTQQAKFYVTTNSNNYDFKDVRQNFLRAIIVAINKYDSSKGALTSYVKWWILNAQTCSSAEHEYGIAYIIPQTQRKKLAVDGANPHSVNFSVSLDSYAQDDGEGETSLYQKIDDNRILDDVVNASRTAEKLSLLVKKVDPHGVARLSLDIGEAFSESEIMLMRRSMREQGLL